MDKTHDDDEATPVAPAPYQFSPSATGLIEGDESEVRAATPSEEASHAQDSE